jgi:hypothetical protein
MYSRSIRLAPPATYPPTLQRSGGNLEPIEKIRLSVFKEQSLYFFTDNPATITSEWLDSLKKLLSSISENPKFLDDEEIGKSVNTAIESLKKGLESLSEQQKKESNFILAFYELIILRKSHNCRNSNRTTPVGW